MNFYESISFIRKRLHIPQGEMLDHTSHSSYSRIENGQRQLKLDTTEQIAHKFGMNFKELLNFTDFDDNYENFIETIRQSMEDPTDEPLKKKFLKKYFPTKDLPKMNSYELTYYYSIKGMLGTDWNEIGIPTQTDISFILNYFTKKSFFTQKDYHIAMNTINFFTLAKGEELITKMYPVILPEKRTASTIRYANHMITNFITQSIYEQKYELALKYIELAENKMDFSIDYYLRLNILYHKNLALLNLKQDTLYIERAREIIKIMYAISDPLTAKQFETELNELTENPKKYREDKNYARTKVKE